MKKTILAAVIAPPASEPSLKAQQAADQGPAYRKLEVLNLKTTAGDKVTYPPGAGGGYVTITLRGLALFVDATRKAPTHRR